MIDKYISSWPLAMGRVQFPPILIGLSPKLVSFTQRENAMSAEQAIHMCFEKTQNHRAVAKALRLPLHYVMYVLGMMPESLFLIVNG